MDVTGSCSSKNDPQGFDFQLSTIFGRGVKEIVSTSVIIVLLIAFTKLELQFATSNLRVSGSLLSKLEKDVIIVIKDKKYF